MSRPETTNAEVKENVFLDINFLTLMFSRLQNGVAVTDPQLCIIWANRAFEKMASEDLVSLRNRRLVEVLLGPHMSNDRVLTSENHIITGRSFRIEVFAYRATGKPRHVDIMPSAIIGDDGTSVSGYLVLLADVDRVQHEFDASLDDCTGASFFREILSCLHVGIAVYGPDERLLLLNDGWKSFRPKSSRSVRPGMTIDEIMSLGLQLGEYLPLVGPNDPPDKQAAYLKKAKTQFRDGKTPRERPLEDGRWINIREARTPSGLIVSITTEVTDLKRQQLLLQELFDSLPTGVLVLDSEERLVLCNEAFQQAAPGLARHITQGMTFEKMARRAIEEGDTAPDLPPDAPEERKEEWVSRILQQFRNPGAVFRRRLRDGRWVQRREQRSPSGYIVSTLTDITELMSTMRDLAAARDEARAAMEAKSRFLARMGHELRTPLNAIIGFGELLEGDRTLSPKQREQVRLIAEAGRHLLELINDLLDLSKIEAGKVELTLRPFDLPALLSSTAELMKAQAQRKRIELRHDLAPDLPRQVRGDATRLRQILLNLLSNAVKFTPVEGRVELRAAAEPAASVDGKTLLRIEVEDSGPGIPKDRLPGLFHDFERGGPSLEPGTGLGLAISARLVEAMGGRIACDSEPGHGALFRVEIPLATVEGAEAIPASATLERAPSATPARPLRVLVVDDVAANRALARTVLAAAGHAVELAEDGETAVAAIASGDFDVVLMDVEMPGIGGLEATRRIRALPPPGGQVPIIALTAAALPEQVAACREAGMDGHLAKPIRRSELLHQLAQVACRRERKRSAPASAESGDAEALMRQALSELERELGEAVASLLSNVAGEFRLGREALARASEEREPPPFLRQTLGRLSAGGRMVGADALAAASDRLFAAIEADQGWREALADTRAALDAALAGLEAWFAAREPDRSTGLRDG